MKHIRPHSLSETEHPRSQPSVHREWWGNGRLRLEIWLLHGVLHREDGPASISYFENGTSIDTSKWIQRGVSHRVGGPAEIQYYENGPVKWERWFQNGARHRDDGPAVLHYDPDANLDLTQWWLKGFALSEESFLSQTTGLTPEQLVRIYAKRQDPKIRRAVQQNPNFPEDLEGWAINLDDWT